MFPEWTWIVGFLIGSFIGSFLNVVIYRMPRAISLSNPSRSFCPNCKHSLGLLDLVPLFSWLLLGRRCRYCKVPIASRYFIVELVNSCIWGGIWYQQLVVNWNPALAIAYMAAASALVAIIWIDWELYVIPDQINAFLAFVGIGLNIWFYIDGNEKAVTWGMPSAMAGWLVGVGVLWGIALFGRVFFRKDAMGHGDIKMARGIGCVLFPTIALLSFGLAIVFGAVFGVIQLLLIGRNTTDQVEVEEGETTEEPESIGSLLWSGLGYLLGIDIVGLFFPSLYKAWFKEEAYEELEDEDFEPSFTMIPFGPYLAIGAIVATVFASPILNAIDSYWNWAVGDLSNFVGTL